MSIPSLPTAGSFTSPFDEEEPNHTVIYSLDMYKQTGGVEYYAGTVGAGKVENNNRYFFTSVPIAFTWNPTAKEAVVTLGNFGWIRNPQEYHAIPKNLTDCRFDSKDAEDSIMCFRQKRYDYDVSVSRTMNAIINDPACTIRVEKFTDEERKEYDAFMEGSPQRLYLQVFNAIAWPQDLTNPTDRMEWLKTNNSKAFEELKDRRWYIENKAMHKYLLNMEDTDGFVGCLDGVLYGPFATEDELNTALASATPVNYPPTPYKMRYAEGYWREFPIDISYDENDKHSIESAEA